MIELACHTSRLAQTRVRRTMRFRRTMAGVACCLLFLGNSASADEANIGNVTPQARILARVFTKCIMGEAGYRVKPLLEIPVSEGKEGLGTFFFPDISQECYRKLPSGFSAPIIVMRGAFFEAMFDRAFAKLPETSAPLTGSVHYPVSDANDPIAEAYRKGIVAADCVARRDWATVTSFLSSDPGSPAEKQLLDPLKGDFAQCGLHNIGVEDSQAVQRALLAEAAYRLVTAPRHAASSESTSPGNGHA